MSNYKIDRNAFADYFSHQLQSYVSSNCFSAHVRVWLSGALDTDVNYESGLTPGQTPNITTPSTGPTVLSFSYTSDASDSAGLGGDMGAMELKTSFNLDVSFAGNAITITQHLVVYLYGRGLFGIDSSGNIVDKTITDTYTLAVTADGDLTAELNSVSEDNSADIGQGGFVNFWSGDMNAVTSAVTDWVRNFVPTRFTDIPMAHIIYTDPS